MNKTFHSYNAWKKYYFPKRYREEMEERAFLMQGFGKCLARQFLNSVRRGLKR